MKQLEVMKKLKHLIPLEMSLTILCSLVVALCVFCSTLYFDYGGGIRSRAEVTWWSVGSGGEKEPFKMDGESESESECDYFDGKWVWDETYPLYDSKDCSFLDGGFRCLENGRPDNFYTKWRWQPKKCNLTRFDAKVMLEKLRNKRLVFVGDSIGRNQWESLMCMLSSAVTDKSSMYEVNGNPISKHTGALVFLFRDYNATIEYYRSPFLVVQGRAPPGSPHIVRTTLRVDQLDWSSQKWVDADVLIFNSGHWWNHEKTIRSGCYFQEGDAVKINMTVEEGFKRSIETLARWVDTRVNTNKTSVYFRSYAPVHFSGGDWKHGGSCHLDKWPDLNMPSLRETWHHYNIVNDVLSDHTNKSRPNSSVNVLDVTYMTLQRRDGHSSVFFLPTPAPLHRQDCSHWCLPGVPDVWNELLYASFLTQQSHNSQISSVTPRAEA